MSDANAFAFGKFIPGFDFLQQLSSAQKAGSGSLPGLGQWVAPTVSVEELDRRITELKAVQFWLDQNATALKATIQALEVQKMTLATLQGMNVSMAEVAKAFTVSVPPAVAPAPAPAPKAATAAPQWPFDQAQTAAAPAPAPVAAPAPLPEPPVAVPEPAPTAEPPPARPRKPKAAAASPDAEASPDTTNAAAKSLADGMQWWGALTQQFQQIAANALREAAPARGSAPTAAATGAKPAKPARKAAAKKKPAAKRGAAKTTAPRKKAATPAKKAAAREPAAAPARNAGWPLPPPAKPR